MALAVLPQATLASSTARRARRNLQSNPKVGRIAELVAFALLTRRPIDLDLVTALLGAVGVRTGAPGSVRLLALAVLARFPAESGAAGLAKVKLAEIGATPLLPDPTSALPEEIVSAAIASVGQTETLHGGFFRALATNPHLEPAAALLRIVIAEGHPLGASVTKALLSALQRRGLHDEVASLAAAVTATDRGWPVSILEGFYAAEVEALISRGDRDAALALVRARFSGAAETLSETAIRLESWRAMMEGEAETARTLFARTTQPALRLAYATATLETVRTPATDPANLKVFLSTNNESELIGAFLAHYRSLAPTTFFIVDNDSTDGTLERLAEEDDVWLYRTSDSFAQSGYGSTWINGLIAAHSRADEFVVRVDADEFLVYPGMGKVSLEHFLAYCTRQDFEAVAGPMVDLHPERSIYSAAATDDPGAVTLRDSRYFEAEYREFGAAIAPYVMGWGGVRSRLFRSSTFLTKTPIVRGGGLVRYYNANHYTTPARIADVSCALLHYKFTPNSFARYQAQIDRGEHFNKGSRYRRFLELIAKDVSLLGPNSRTYEGPADLEAAGLMRTSDAYQAFCDAR